MIRENIDSVRQRISDSCARSGRLVGDVKLVIVTKAASGKQVGEVIGMGLNTLGENRVQDATERYAVFGDTAEWHLIGHLQTNKVKDAVRIFKLIHSVDSARLMEAINKEALKSGKVQDVLLQVNISGEDSKFGVKPEESTGLIKIFKEYKNIMVLGLMTIAPEVKDPEEARPFFRALRELRDHINSLNLTTHNLKLLSMGMTNDFEVAVEEGSNIIRIGRAIFRGGSR